MGNWLSGWRLRWCVRILGIVAVGVVGAAVALFYGGTPSASKNEGKAAAGARQAEPPYRDISPEEAMRRLGRGDKAVLLDVRTPEEHAEKRIPGSVLLPLGPPADMAALARKLIPDKNTPLFVYCRSGRRSVEAATILASLGYRNVYNLGGIISWPYATE